MKAQIIKAFENALIKKEERQWKFIYLFFDIHETILYPDYGDHSKPLTFYPYAEEVLQHLSNNSDYKLGLYTCSYPDEIENYIKFFESKSILFNFKDNRNQEVANNAYGYYRNKPYFNVLFDDKAGFDAEHDWELLFDYLKL